LPGLNLCGELTKERRIEQPDNTKAKLYGQAGIAKPASQGGMAVRDGIAKGLCSQS